MIVELPSPAAEDLLIKFNELWQDGDRFTDVTGTVIELIDTVYKENAPELIYFITLYNIFHEFLADLSEDSLPNERTGFKDTVIWRKLYDFQKDAALAIINKLQRYNGCILADSVGLGKTFTALAVIKYYELRNQNVLVLCPKKLNDNWLDYTQNYVGNPLVSDRFGYKVLYHTDMSRREGKTNGIDLAKLNWGNYDLLVIDESHNFRNGGKPVATDAEGNERDDLDNRYDRLMCEVIRKGVKTKVLMLSATPVNNGFNDLKHQLALAYEGESEKLDSLLDTKKGVELIFRDAQKEYNKWIKQPETERTTAALMERLSPDLFQLLDSVTIARSRRHIEKFYDMTAIGKFPERLPPISRRPKLTDIPNAVTYREIYAEINKLNLAIYTPLAFVLEIRKAKYSRREFEQGERGLSFEGREQGIRKLMAVNLLKRLESSVNSFRLTLEKVRDFLAQMIHRIDCYEESDELETAPYLDDDEGETYEEGSLKIPLCDLDRTLWREYLAADLEVFGRLLGMVSAVTPEHDSKLAAIRQEILDKVTHPFNEGNRKVLVFTAFEDTARYLYENLNGCLKTELGLETAMVSGGSAFCTHRQVKANFSDILLNFSPLSKERPAAQGKQNTDIDILIATDCISEGQNLQDCDFLVNYDIHWNPVRIIQRFGRIDRIGSRNSEIQLVNYWPDMELDEYIQLKERVESRMKVSVMTASGDGNPLSSAEKGDLEYRRRQLKKLQEEVVDLEDMDAGINIMDLGLNDFRQDLPEYIKTHPDLDHTPFGMSAVAGASDKAKPGVIFVLRNRNEGVNPDRENPLHPFYMVHLGFDGSVVTDHLSPKKLLDTMRSACKRQAAPNKQLAAAFNKETRDGRKMDRYSELLQTAIRSIAKVKDESDNLAFLKGETPTFKTGVRGLDDFELICFLVLREGHV